MAQLTKKQARQRRHNRVRKKVFGTAHCPRLAVYRSDSQVYAQFIDDMEGHTLTAASTLDAEVDKGGRKYPTVEDAKQVGQLVAQRADNNNIRTAVFDRGGFKFHGKIKAVAESVREHGIKV